MTGLVRKATLLTACGLLAAASAFASVPSPANCTVPCAIVLVGHNGTNSAADAYGTFTVIVRDATNAPIAGCTVTVDLSACCTDIKLSNTQLGTGVSHSANAAFVTGTTDATGTMVFIVEGAASQGAGPSTGLVSPNGCATITATPVSSSPVTIASNVLVSTPDENRGFTSGGTIGDNGVDPTDLSVFINDKNAYTVSTANYRQRSDFDFHLPVFACSHVFNSSSGYGDNLGDLAEWVKIKNALNSIHSGPFPGNCP